jgi:putative peptidoglycan lipid II flippase
LAHEFGAGLELDLYYAAFRIPDLLYVLFASTLSVYVLIPFVAERIKGQDASKARELLSQIFSLFLVAYIALAACIAFLAPFLAGLLFPGFTDSQMEQFVVLIRILLLQPFFLGISSLLGVITQFSHRFVLYALSPLVYNVGIIFGLLALFPHYGLTGLVFGVVLGAIGHLLIQLPFVLKSELVPTFLSTFVFSEIKEVLQTSIPRALTLSLHQFVLLGLVGFASAMTVGSVAVFQFAFNLQSVPLAIIGVSYSVAAFPFLAQLYAEKKFEQFADRIITVLHHIIFWSVPVIALLVVIRAQFVRAVLGSGEFDWSDTRLTAAVLALFAFSLTSQAIHLLIVRALYATGNTRLPFYTTLLSSVLALVFAFCAYLVLVFVPDMRAALESLMRLEDVPGTEVLALPLGYSLALLVHSVVLLVCSRKILQIDLRKIVPQLLRAGAAAGAAGFIAYFSLNFIVEHLPTETLLGIFLQGLFAGVMGILAAGLAYFLLRSPELEEVRRVLHRKLRGADVIVPQDEDHLAV